MAKYAHSIAGVALSTSADLFTVVTTTSGAGSVVGLYELYLGGEAGSSAVARVCLNRPSGVMTTASTTATLAKIHPASATNTFNVITAWGGNGTLSTNHVLVPVFNAFAGIVRWVAPPDSSIIVGSQGAAAQLSCRSLSGTSTVSGHALLEEY